MRILQVGKFPKEYCGGVERAVFTLSERLAQEHDVEVVTSNLAPRLKTERSGRLVHHSLPTWLQLFSTPITPSLFAYFRSARFDVVQISFQNPMAAAAYLWARPQGKLVVWYHHDIIRQRLLGPLIAPLLSRVLKAADRIVATSGPYARSSKTLAGFLEKTTVIPLGVDAERLNEERGISESRRIRSEYGSPIVLFIGRLVYYKGLPVLLEAMKGVAARLLVIGSGPLEAELKRLAAGPGLAGKVTFRSVPQEEPLGKYLHACDLLVLPSTERTEAYGLTLLEAMACAKPVIATELGTGTSFVCQHGINGLVVPPGDAAALRSAIQAVLSDPDKARRMGEAGRGRVRDRFTLEGMARQFVGLYRQLLGDDRPC
ncbi:MAG: glycosyltransferase [Elusimicrobiota bacterium]